MPQTKEIQIIKRDGLQVSTPKVKVLWECPTCGEPMGQLWGHTFYEDGQSYFCHRWENPCGHVAKYDELKVIEHDI